MQRRRSNVGCARFHMIGTTMFGGSVALPLLNKMSGSENTFIAVGGVIPIGDLTYIIFYHSHLVRYGSSTACSGYERRTIRCNRTTRGLETKQQCKAAVHLIRAQHRKSGKHG